MSGRSPRSMQQWGAGWSPNGADQEEAGDQRQPGSFSHQAVRSCPACSHRKGQEETRHQQVPPGSASSLAHQVDRTRNLPSLLPSHFQRGTQTPSPYPLYTYTHNAHNAPQDTPPTPRPVYPGGPGSKVRGPQCFQAEELQGWS